MTSHAIQVGKVGFSRGVLLAGVSLLQFAAPAAAQEAPVAKATVQSATPSDKADAEQSAELVVTGSRIVRDGYTAPTPVTVATSDELVKATPTSIQEGLYKLPQFRLSGGPARSNHNQVVSGGTHGYVLNLRGIGGNRTLVLFDGIRMPPTHFGGTVDVSVVPNLLIERVEIVTGGASAAYGSDAVAGVVNFVLNKSLTGITGVAQSGVSERGDNQNYRLGIAGGFGFGGGAGHVLLSAEYYNNEGMLRGDRPSGRAGYVIAGSNPNCAPFTGACAPGGTSNPYTIVSNSRLTSAADLGKVNSGPAALVNTLFKPDGSVRPFNSGTLTGTPGFAVGGDGYIIPDSSTSIAPQKSIQTFGRASYDMTPDITVFAQGIFTRSDLSYNSFSNAWTGVTLAPIFSGNPFLNPSVQANMGPNDVIMVAHQNTSGLPLETKERTDFWMATAGIEGKFGNGWNWNASYTHGNSKHDVEQVGNYDWRKAYAAVDAVRDPAGNIVCRPSLDPDPAIRQRYADCKPINLMGVNPQIATPAGYAYATGAPHYIARIKQDAFQASISGSPFSLPAGPVDIAVGGEWRKQTLHLTSNSDPALLDNNPAGERAAYFAGLRGVAPSALFFWVTNVGVADGNVTVKEGFAEISVPIVKDVPLIKSLTINGAGRITDYSTSGSVKTWKVGALWRPIPDLLLRGTKSRDIRAPSLFDLFAGPQSNIGQTFDPVTGINLNLTQIVGGNPNLKPEVSDTITFGGVITPSFLPGFSLAVDYYKIKIDGAIGSLLAAQILQNCFNQGPSAPECALIDRPAPNQFPTLVRRTPANIAFLKTAGVDIDASYRTSLGNGSLSVRLYANYLDKFETQQFSGAPVLDYRGIATPLSSVEARPKWSGTLNVNYKVGNFGIFVSEQYVGKMRLALPGAPSNFASDTKINPVWYTDLTMSYNIPALGGNNEFFLTVNNLFDKDPPLIPANTPGVNIPTAQSIYDTVGRAYTVGMRFKF